MKEPVIIAIIETNTEELHFVKSVQTRSYFWFVFYCIRTEYRKILTRNNSVFVHFLRSAGQNV